MQEDGSDDHQGAEEQEEQMEERQTTLPSCSFAKGSHA